MLGEMAILFAVAWLVSILLAGNAFVKDAHGAYMFFAFAAWLMGLATTITGGLWLLFYIIDYAKA